MSGRPNWHPEYWKKIDKEAAKKILTTCPKCGSDKTYYNAKFKVWRCGKCENSYSVNGIKESNSWWRRLIFWNK